MAQNPEWEFRCLQRTFTFLTLALAYPCQERSQEGEG